MKENLEEHLFQLYNIIVKEITQYSTLSLEVFDIFFNEYCTFETFSKISGSL